MGLDSAQPQSSAPRLRAYPNRHLPARVPIESLPIAKIGSVTDDSYRADVIALNIGTPSIVVAAGGEG
jgi:hypothetical protein